MIPRNSRISADNTFSIRRHRPDYHIIVVAFILLAIGLVVMYSISPALADLGGDTSKSHFVSRQFISVVFSLLAFAVASKLPIRFYEKYRNHIVVVSLLLCVSTIAFGGIASRWIQLGVFSFQPVETAKFALIIAGSYLLVGNTNLLKTQNFKVIAGVVGLFAMVIVVLQRDLGSAVVLACMMCIMAFIAGVPLKYLGYLVGIATLVGVIAIASTTYRRDRISTFFQPEKDCTNSGYHACQAMIAVGSGGVLGQGLGRSVQAYGYLPEAANDSIFAIYAEKFGFVGSITLVGLFGYLLFRILKVMQRAPNKVTQIMSAGIFSWLGIQAIFNVGAMIGLLPLKGITLPLVSYGGSSIIFTMAALGLVFQISSYTLMRSSNIRDGGERNEGISNGRWNSRTRYTITRSSR